MSRLSEMIKKLCPDGVEYRKLGETVSICRGIRVVRAELQSEGEYPVYQNSLIPMGYYDKSNCSGRTSFIIGAGAAGEIGYSEVDFWAADDCFYFVCEENVNSRFLYHVLLGQESLIKGQVRKASIPRLSRTVVEKLLVPVPPLPIQNEIAKLLDNFTEITAELTAMLTAELVLRKKQYNFYRDGLLNFVRVDDTIVQTDRQTDRQTALRIGKIGLSNELIELQRFDKYCTYVRGVTYNKMQEAKKEDCATWKVLRANNITLETNTMNTDDVKLIKKDVQVKEEQLLKEGDILICAGSGSRSHIGKVAYIERDMNYTFGGFMAVIRCDDCVNKRYLFHVLRSCLFSSYLDRTLNSSTINNLNYSVMKGFEFPMPSITLQNKIAAILDRFDTLCNDLTQGLPAEIAARKKQYEYYRDKLLTFSRKDA